MSVFDTALPPAEIVARVEASARRLLTPAADGAMVWRIWGEGPPVVLIHGNFGSWTHWLRNIEPLAQHFTVMLPDAPGFGESRRLPPPSSPREVVRTLAHGMETVLPEGAPFHLVGFSYGGRIGAEYAAHEPDRIASVTLFGPGGTGFPDAPRPKLRSLRPHMPPEEIAAVHRHNLGALMFGDQARVDDLAVYLQNENTRRTRFKLSDWTEDARMNSTAHALPLIRAPLRVIWGDRDAFARDTLKEREAVVRAAQPDSVVRILPGYGHWTPYEGAEEVNALLFEFLG